MAPQLHVAGSHLVDGGGAVVHLHGVDRSGTEYACVQGWGIFDGPSDRASIAAMSTWGVNAVRVPLNEDCWLGINGVSASYSGAAYRAAIEQYVAGLHELRMVAILDLHWSAAGTALATGQQPMPDADHAPQFWTSVAAAFGTDRATVFDLFNEPYPDGNRDTTAAWTCWRDGGAACPDLSYAAAGMRSLVTAVRGTGATNVVMLGGVQYANAVDQWRAFAPVDAADELAASFHMYGGNACSTPACWDAAVAPLSSTVPVVTGEFGEAYTGADCGTSLVSQYMSWADRLGISYLAWTWDTWGGCGTLITSYAGTPTAFGVAVREHYATLVPPPAPTPRACLALSAAGPACPLPTGPAATPLTAARSALARGGGSAVTSSASPPAPSSAPRTVASVGLHPRLGGPAVADAPTSVVDAGLASTPLGAAKSSVRRGQNSAIPAAALPAAFGGLGLLLAVRAAARRRSDRGSEKAIV